MGKGKAAAALLALFVPKLIEMALGGVASLLKRAGDKETVSVAGHDFTEFYIADQKQVLRVNKQIGCILGIWGIFRDADGERTPDDDIAVRRLEEAGLVPPNADIRIIFEASIRLASDETAFYLDTRHFSVRDFIGGRNKSDRAFLVTLGVTAPGATADGDTIAVGNVDMGKLKRGADLIPRQRPADGYPRFRSNLMPWNQISQASKSVYDADVAAGNAIGRRYMPVTFNLTISETADGNALLAKLGELLDGAKKDAAEQIGKLILPEERERTEAARAEAAEKLYENELAGEIAVREANKAYNEGTEAEKPVLAAKLEGAKRKLERQKKLREAAGLPDRPAIPSN